VFMMKEGSVWDNAFWIGPSDEQLKKIECRERMPIESAYFRRKFSLDGPAGLELAISSSGRYRLWVNGTHITFGPCKGDRWRKYYETVDVSKFLHKGSNEILVKVVAFPPYEAQSGG